MQNLFVKEDDEFVVKFTVATDKDGTIFCDLKKGSLIESLQNMGYDTGAFEVADYQAVFRKPSFGDTMGLYDSIFSVTDEMSVNFNPVLARYKKITALIKNWNLKGTDEKPTEAEIQQLHPVIANAIGIQIDLETGGILS